MIAGKNGFQHHLYCKVLRRQHRIHILEKQPMYAFWFLRKIEHSQANGHPKLANFAVFLPVLHDSILSLAF